MELQQFEQAILRLAFETNARITAASVAYYLGIPSRESNRMLNELLKDGVLELDSDEHGNLYYHVPQVDAPPSLVPEVPEQVAAPKSSDPHDLLARHGALSSPNDEDHAPAHSPFEHKHNQGSDGGWSTTPDSPNGPSGLAGVMRAPESAPSQALAQPEPRFEHPAIQRHSEPERPSKSAYRNVLMGVTSKSMEHDAWVGNCGTSAVVVTPEARCEPKPLADARPSIVSCVEPAAQQAPSQAMTYNTPEQVAPRNDWWQNPQPHNGAMVLAGHGNLPATMSQLEQPEHQPGMALLLSLILCGTGQIYNGEVSKGIMMMVLCFLLWFVLLGWVVHIWSIVDAVVVAERINRRQHA